MLAKIMPNIPMVIDGWGGGREKEADEEAVLQLILRMAPADRGPGHFCGA